ncbi:MAG TPA: DUF3551 domain-containing protein [Afipia sp.]
MKKLTIGVAAIGLTALAASVPSQAQARNYKYCLYQDRMGGGDCSFVSYEQCRASASGRIADCRINPMWAYGGQDQPVKKKHRRKH